MTLVDLNVYSSNQNFRLILSSKFRERGRRPLQMFLPHSREVRSLEHLTYDTFRDTLLSCNGWHKNNLLAWPSVQKKIINRRHNQNRNIVPRYRREERFIANPDPLRQNPDRGPPIHHNLARDQYPNLKAYFTTQVLPHWPQLLHPNIPPTQSVGTITHVEYSRYSRNFVCVKVVGNRFCHSAQRQHRSNNIYFVLDLKEFVFRQGCYDIACNGALSQALPIPPEILF